MTSVLVERVNRTFGRVAALVDIDLAVRPGEVVAIVGPNGAGKSTLLRILGTSLLPDSGRAQVAGHDVERDTALARRSVGFLLAEERSWYWRLSGRHNLEFFAALHGMARPQARRRAAELLAEVGLAEAADRRFDGYSSGMRLRLSLARALLSTPPVLLLDEPTRSLDPVATTQFHELMRFTTRRRRTAVLVATHDLHEAASLADRVNLLVAGRLSAAPNGDRSAEALAQALLSVSR